jgi:S-adenosylmethionine decarboxylase proenzyme
VLYTADAWCPDHPLLTDAPGLVAAARSAVATGGGHVLDEVRVVFPNRAITVVLVLAESHLSMHTWPEEGLIAIDLFSCGAIDGTVVIDGLRAAIGPRRMTVSRTVRGGV